MEAGPAVWRLGWLYVGWAGCMETGPAVFEAGLTVWRLGRLYGGWAGCMEVGLAV